MSEEEFPAATDGDWMVLSDDTVTLLAERLYDFGALDRKRKVKSVRATKLPFYEDQLLCDVATTARRQPDEWLSCLYGPDGVRPLTGRSEVIHALNGKVEPDLGAPTVQDAYLRFFCRFVHGQEGPFEIVTDTAQFTTEDDEIDVEPPVFDAEDALWSAFVLYGGALFKATFTVEADGHVRMEDDTPISQNVVRVPDVQFDGAVRRLRPPFDEEA